VSSFAITLASIARWGKELSAFLVMHCCWNTPIDDLSLKESRADQPLWEKAQSNDQQLFQLD
jgi:hypothetical protein